MCVCLLSSARLFGTPWTIDHQAPLVHATFQSRILKQVLQRTFPTQESKLHLSLLHWQGWVLYH